MPNDDELEFVQQLEQIDHMELINFYLDLIATYSAPVPQHRRNAIELTQRELERRSDDLQGCFKLPTTRIVTPSAADYLSVAVR